MADAKAAEIGLKIMTFSTHRCSAPAITKCFSGNRNSGCWKSRRCRKNFMTCFSISAPCKKKAPIDVKNYSPELADELVRRCMDQGLAVGCYGHPAYAYCPKDCADLRNADLRQTVAAISSARAAVGEASGGMHLANACGKPTIIWGEGQRHIAPALRWNPFRVPIYVVTIATWRPTAGRGLPVRGRVAG